MILILAIISALEYQCLAQMRSSFHSIYDAEDHGSVQQEENIDKKYFHPYMFTSKDEIVYYLQLGVKNGQITQYEMDRELERLEHPLTPRVDQRSKLKKIRYWFYSKAAGRPYYQLLGRRAAAKQRAWNYGQEVKIIIHGWSNNLDLSSDDKIGVQGMWSMANAYLRYPYNIIVVDWTVLSSETFIHYATAAEGAVIAAEDVAAFVEDLKAKGLIRSMKQVHIIGFSLGAHVSGRTGYLLSRSHEKVARITGLDPAGPNFAYYTQVGKDLRYAHISSSNAEFVDIVHCNQGNAVAGNVGSDKTAGHADFIANGGSSQPGCTIVDDYQGCSHGKCPVYFRDSIIQKNGMKACRKLDNSDCPWYNPTCWFSRRSALSGQQFIHQSRFGRQGLGFVPPTSRIVGRVSAREVFLSGRATKGTDCVSFGEWCPRTASGIYYLTT